VWGGGVVGGGGGVWGAPQRSPGGIHFQGFATAFDAAHSICGSKKRRSVARRLLRRTLPTALFKSLIEVGPHSGQVQYRCWRRSRSGCQDNYGFAIAA